MSKFPFFPTQNIENPPPPYCTVMSQQGEGDFQFYRRHSESSIKRMSSLLDEDDI